MHGKKPTVKQCNMIRKAGLNPDNWLIAKNTSTEIVLIHRHSEKTTKTIPKEFM
jgi:hypothetical protein